MIHASKKLGTMMLALGLMTQSALAADIALRFSWWGGGERHEATNAAIKAFEAKNPGVTIKGEYGGFLGYVDKMSVQMAGGVEPDIIQSDWAWLSQFSKDGNGFYDLKKANQVQLDAFIGESWKTGLINGKLNGVPSSYTARVFLWNKSTWDKAGLPLPKTWDELLAAGKVFEQKLGKDHFPLDSHLYDAVMVAQAYMLQKTGKSWIYSNQAKVAYSQAEALEWVRFYKRMVDQHVISTLQYRVSAAGGNIETPVEQLPDWVSGKFAGSYVWDSVLKTRISTAPKSMTFEIGNFPTLPDAKDSGYFGRPAQMFVVSKNSKNPEMAAKFVNWMVNSPEAAGILGTVRGVSMSQAFRDTQINANKFTPIETTAMNQIAKAQINVPSPLIESPRIRTWVVEVFEKFAQGKITDQEAAKMLVDETNAQLRRLK